MRHRTRIPVLAAALLAGALPALCVEDTFVFDKAHSVIGFKIRHVVSRVEGRFHDFDGTIWLDRQNPAASKAELTIRTASIDTGVDGRDKDLRSPNFFDVEKYPTITFRSTTVEPKGNGVYEVTGELTMHGVTRTIRVPVKHTGFAKMGKGEKAGFQIDFPLARKDYGITWNRALDEGGLLLGENVEIAIEVEANKKVNDK